MGQSWDDGMGVGWLRFSPWLGTGFGFGCGLGCGFGCGFGLEVQVTGLGGCCAARRPPPKRALKPCNPRRTRTPCNPATLGKRAARGTRQAGEPGSGSG